MTFPPLNFSNVDGVNQLNWSLSSYCYALPPPTRPLLPVAQRDRCYAMSFVDDISGPIFTSNFLCSQLPENRFFLRSTTVRLELFYLSQSSLPFVLGLTDDYAFFIYTTIIFTTIYTTITYIYKYVYDYFSCCKARNNALQLAFVFTDDDVVGPPRGSGGR